MLTSSRPRRPGSVAAAQDAPLRPSSPKSSSRPRRPGSVTASGSSTAPTAPASALPGLHTGTLRNSFAGDTLDLGLVRDPFPALTADLVATRTVSATVHTAGYGDTASCARLGASTAAGGGAGGRLRVAAAQPYEVTGSTGFVGEPDLARRGGRQEGRWPVRAGPAHGGCRVPHTADRRSPRRGAAPIRSRRGGRRAGSRQPISGRASSGRNVSGTPMSALTRTGSGSRSDGCSASWS
jgi:hypothetical protein